MNLTKNEWIKSWETFYKTDNGRKLLNEIHKKKLKDIYVFDENYLNKNNQSQKNRETFTFPIYKEEYNILNYKFKLLCTSIEKIIKVILNSPDLLKNNAFSKIDIKSALRETVLFDYIRIDGFYNDTTKTYKAIEINSYSPAMYRDSDLINSFTNKDCLPGISHLIAQSHFEISCLKNPHNEQINILLLVDKSTPPEYLNEIHGLLKDQNVILHSMIGFKNLFQKLSLENNYLYFTQDNKKIRINQLISKTKFKLIKKNGSIRTYKIGRAYAAEKLALIPAPVNLLLGKKSIYPLLRDKVIQKSANLSKDEEYVLDEMIPNSIKLDLIHNFPETILHHENWVLKYSDNSGGKDIYIGAEYSKDVWKHLLKKAMNSKSKVILQERINIPKSKLLFHYEKESIRELPFSFEPFIVNLPVTDGYLVAGFSGRAYSGNEESVRIRFNPSDNNEKISFGSGHIINEK